MYVVSFFKPIWLSYRDRELIVISVEPVGLFLRALKIPPEFALMLQIQQANVALLAHLQYSFL